MTKVPLRGVIIWLALLRRRSTWSPPAAARPGGSPCHDAESQLARITAPTLVTFGRFDLVCSMRFAETLTGNIKNAELHVFEDCAHAPIYQNVEAFNQRTLAFLDKHAA